MCRTKERRQLKKLKINGGHLNLINSISKSYFYVPLTICIIAYNFSFVNNIYKTFSKNKQFYTKQQKVGNKIVGIVK